MSHALLPFLAQAESSGEVITDAGFWDHINILNNPDVMLDYLAQIPLYLAATVAGVGVLCVLNGYRWHRWIVAILGFFLGVGLGYQLSKQMGKPFVVAAAVGGLMAMVAAPMMRLSVALFAGIVGGFIGSNAWAVVPSLNADDHWAGAVVGFIVLAMLSFVLFRFVVVLFTSIGGAAMAIAGALTLLMSVPDWEPSVRESLASTPMLLPLLLALGGVGGFVLQESRLRNDGVKVFSNESSEE